MTKRAVSPARGTQPPGSTDEAAAACSVRKLFSDITPRYDLLNHLLSLNMDRYWRRATARRFRPLLRQPDRRVLDLCCGTADLTLALGRQGPARIISCDFSHPMLVRAQQKLRQLLLPPLVMEADALRLPFADNSFDLVACSFGFRNLANYHSGLREIWRVLRPGGEAGILEFALPDGRCSGALYAFYFHRILPAIGEWVSGVGGSYSYLPRSVNRFPDRQEFVEWMRKADFVNPAALALTWGIAVLYSAKKPSL